MDKLGVVFKDNNNNQAIQMDSLTPVPRNTNSLSQVRTETNRIISNN